MSSGQIIVAGQPELYTEIFQFDAIFAISFKVAIDLLVYTKMEFEKLKNIENPFMRKLVDEWLRFAENDLRTCNRFL